MENDINYIENKNIPTQQHKPKSENWIVGITIATLLISLLGKILTTGMITFILSLFMIIPAQFIIFTVVGLDFAKVKDKKIIDYVIYAFICITMIVYAYFFIDTGELADKITIFTWVEEEKLSTFSEISTNSYVVNFILTIILTIRCSIKKIKYRKSNNNTTEQMQQPIMNKEENVDNIQENYKVPIILKVVCFLLPIVGIIIGIYYKKSNKKLSKSCAISALIGFIALIIIMRLINIISLISLRNKFNSKAIGIGKNEIIRSQYYDNYYI